MSEDAPVNTGVVSWPDPYSAGVAVRSMQTKLHLWAARDAGRRFGDLFNLVYDPAFLVVAWERVSTNKGVRLFKRCLFSGYFGHAARLRSSMVAGS